MERSKEENRRWKIASAAAIPPPASAPPSGGGDEEDGDRPRAATPLYRRWLIVEPRKERPAVHMRRTPLG